MLYGWDVGGAHVKACRLEGGVVVDVAQWPCPLWQGLDQLAPVLAAALQRWPGLDASMHAVTMTGEMVDLFADREDGVCRIAAALTPALAPVDPSGLRFFAGDAGWCGAEELAGRWPDVASANWLATARHAASDSRADSGVLVDIGSTTTDLIAFRHGRVLGTSRSDADRLVTGELFYQGVVRTPLCALAPQIGWRGRPHNVMNEWFATTADVYRLTGELDPAHDQQPTADQGPKDMAGSRRRLARMIGLDARDGTPDDWLDFARAWRACQVAALAGQLQRVMAAHALADDGCVVSAGCGAFLLPDMLARTTARGSAGIAYGSRVARLAPGRADLEAWAQVCAPCIAVATLLDRERR